MEKILTPTEFIAEFMKLVEKDKQKGAVRAGSLPPGTAVQLHEFAYDAYCNYEELSRAKVDLCLAVGESEQIKDLKDRIKELEDDLACYRAMSMDSNQKA